MPQKRDKEKGMGEFRNKTSRLRAINNKQITMKYVLFERQYYTGNNKKPAEDAITAFAKANNAEAVGIMPIPNTNSIYVLFKVPEN